MQPKTQKPIEVSIIVPCYNEADTIRLLLGAILKQSFPLKLMEVVISDAMSEDGTRKAINQFALENPGLSIQVVDNPQRTIPAGVNSAAAAARGKYLVRMDAHSVPDRDYIKNSIQLLKDGIADNVGGIWQIEPGGNTCIAKAIAAAAAHPLGAGDALYRIASKAAFVDTVPFGAFSKETFERVGRFDEKLLSNEDYEFNTRIRLAGGKIYLDPRIHSKYFARKTLSGLAKQYWRYGYWKYRMLKRYPQTLRWRQAMPPIFIFSLILLIILSSFLPIARIILTFGLSLYLLVLLLFSLIESIRKKEYCYIEMIFALVVMHFCWGSGFLYSCIDRTHEV
jgi:succinoglycan biosynthesis protein ExoA